MSYEEEDTCMSYEEEDTCMSYEEEDTCSRSSCSRYRCAWQQRLAPTLSVGRTPPPVSIDIQIYIYTYYIHIAEEDTYQLSLSVDRLPPPVSIDIHIHILDTYTHTRYINRKNTYQEEEDTYQDTIPREYIYIRYILYQIHTGGGYIPGGGDTYSGYLQDTTPRAYIYILDTYHAQGREQHGAKAHRIYL